MQPITMLVTGMAMLAAKVLKALGQPGGGPPGAAHRPLAWFRRRARGRGRGRGAAAAVAVAPSTAGGGITDRAGVGQQHGPGGVGATLADLDLAGDPDLAGDTGRGLLGTVDAARQLLGVDTARLLLAGADGRLRWATAVDRDSRVVADPHRRFAHGPSLVAFEDGRIVAVDDLDADPRWAALPRQLPGAGALASLSVPIELAAGPVGVLELSCRGARRWDGDIVAAARAHAGVLGLLLAETLAAAAARRLAGQLQHALSARIRVEQAKGVLMAREGLGERAAWERLRRAARDSRRPVDAVARELLTEHSLRHDRPPEG